MKLYTTQFCPKCELAKSVLDNSGYTYETVTDEQEAINLGLKGVPCVITDSGKTYGLREIISICKGEGSFE